MGIYTINNDPAVDQIIQNVLDMVVEGILDLIGKHYVQSIVLTGGFGRGEGGVYQDKHGYQLVNDLDFEIFIKKRYYYIIKKKYSFPLKKLCDDLQSHARGIKQIDINITNSWLYRFVPNLVFYYEIKNGYKTVYGNINLPKIMPCLNAENLPIFDGTNYFRTRGSGMLLSAIYFLTNSLDSPKIRENFQIEIQKACLAMGDALLLLDKQYHYSYQERLRRIKNFKSNNEVVPEHLLKKIIELYCWGSERKLKPLFEWTGNEAMVEKWFEVREIFGEFFLWFESGRLNKNFKNWLDYSEYIQKNGISEPWDVKLWNLLIRCKRLIKKFYRKCIQEKQIQLKEREIKDLLAILPLLLFSLQKNYSITEKSLLRACNLLRISSGKKDIFTWIDAVKKYLSYWHPAGVVQEAICLNDDKQLFPIIDNKKDKERV